MVDDVMAINNSEKDLLETSDEASINGENDMTATVFRPKKMAFRILPTKVSPYPIYTVLLLNIFIIKIVLVASQDLIYNKLCYFKFHNLSLCSNTTFSSSHPQLQADATDWNMYIAIIQLVPAVASNLLLSSYCDKVAHKLLLVLPNIGIMLASAWMSFLAAPRFIELPMPTVLLYGFLLSLFGYYPMVLMSSFSYISRSCPAESRHIYIAVGEGCLLFGGVLAGLVTGPIVEHLGLDVLVYINTGMCLVTVLTAAFLVVDISQDGADKISWREFFRPKEIFSAIICICKYRTERKRLLLFTICGAFMFTMTAIDGIMAVSFLYGVKTLGMSLTAYSIYTSVIDLLKSFGGPAVMILAKRLKIEPLYIAHLIIISLIVGYIVMSLRDNLYFFWIGSVLLFPQIMPIGVIRNEMIKLVSENEYGKIFAFVSLMQVILQFIANLIYNGLYGWSVAFWPQMFAALCSFLYVMTFALIAVFSLLKLKYIKQ